jgi:hypothetical protein
LSRGFFDFFKIFLEAFQRPSLNFSYIVPPQAPEVKNFLSKSCTISGDPRHDFLCSLPIDFLLAVVYNENSARCVRQRAVEEGIVHFDEKRGATPLLGPAHIQKFKQIFVLVWECDRMSAILCQMFGVNIPPHALDNFNRGGFAVGVHKLKPYGLFHYFSFLPFRSVKSGKDFKQVYLCGVD